MFRTSFIFNCMQADTAESNSTVCCLLAGSVIILMKCFAELWAGATCFPAVGSSSEGQAGCAMGAARECERPYPIQLFTSLIQPPAAMQRHCVCASLAVCPLYCFEPACHDKLPIAN